MTAEWMTRAIWGAGVVHAGIVLANIPLPGRLRVRERLAPVPRFLRQIFYVHWIYIVIVVGLFAALRFGFAPELAGGGGVGRFFCGVLGGGCAVAGGGAGFFFWAGVAGGGRRGGRVC